MGRPTKKEQEAKALREKAVQALAELGINLDDLIDDSKDEDSVIVEDNIKVEIKANLSGTTVLKTKGTNLFKKLPKRGAKSRIKFSDLDALLSEHPNMLMKGHITISKVLSKDLTLDNIVEELGLEDIYLDKNKISPNEIEVVLSDKVDSSKFNSLLYNTPYLGKAILDTAIDLHRNGKFNDGAKISILRQAFANPRLF